MKYFTYTDVSIRAVIKRGNKEYYGFYHTDDDKKEGFSIPDNACFTIQGYSLPDDKNKLMSDYHKLKRDNSKKISIFLIEEKIISKEKKFK